MTPRKPQKPGAPAKVRAAKGSVKEAIGKLIGDDAVERRGTAEKAAGATAAKPTKGRP